jgi:hypothetical protein
VATRGQATDAEPAEAGNTRRPAPCSVGTMSLNQARLVILLALGSACSAPVESKRVVYHAHYDDKEVYSTYCVQEGSERLIERETFDRNGALLLREIFEQDERYECPEGPEEPAPAVFDLR